MSYFKENLTYVDNLSKLVLFQSHTSSQGPTGIQRMESSPYLPSQVSLEIQVITYFEAPVVTPCPHLYVQQAALLKWFIIITCLDFGVNANKTGSFDLALKVQNMIVYIVASCRII